MKKIILIILFLTTSVFAQEKEQLPEKASEKEKVTIEKGWEREFDEEIVDVVMPDEEEIKALDLEGKSFHPKIVVTKRGIKFLDKLGKTKKEYPLKKRIGGKRWSRIRMSKNKKYIGIADVEYKYANEYVPPPWGYYPSDAIDVIREYTLLDGNGKISWELDKIRQMVIIPSPNGKYAVGLGLDEVNDVPPAVYNSKGLLPKCKMSPEDFEGSTYEQKHEKYWEYRKKFWPEGLVLSTVDFASDGRFFVCSTSPDNHLYHKGYLIMFDSEYNELWRKEIGEGTNALKVSSNDNYIAVEGGENWREPELYFFNNKGDLLWTKLIPPIGNYRFNFSSNEKLLFITAYTNILFLFETLTGKTIWEYKDKNKNCRFRNAVTTPDFEFILVGGAEVVKINIKPGTKTERDFVILFDKKGKILWQKDFPPDSLALGQDHCGYYCDLNITPKGKRLLIRTSDGIKIFRNKFAE